MMPDPAVLEKLYGPPETRGAREALMVTLSWLYARRAHLDALIAMLEAEQKFGTRN